MFPAFAPYQNYFSLPGKSMTAIRKNNDLALFQRIMKEKQ